MKKKNIAIVTGASSGLGKEFVKLLSAKKGLDEIWIISRNEEKLKKIQKRYGEKIVVYPMDLSSPLSKILRLLVKIRALKTAISDT